MKSAKATILQRVEAVLSLRLLGAELPDIRQFASQQAPPWDVSDRQLWRYIEGADKRLAETLDKDRERCLNRHLAQRRALYSRCMAVSDYANARAILKDEAELLGLYPPKRTELTGANGGPVQTATVELSEDERDAAIAAVLARVGRLDNRPITNRTGDGAGSNMGAAGSSDDGSGVDARSLADEALLLNL
jgi:hypothetical protein